MQAPVSMSYVPDVTEVLAGAPERAHATTVTAAATSATTASTRELELRRACVLELEA
jgi:hypothetical protein